MDCSDPDLVATVDLTEEPHQPLFDKKQRAAIDREIARAPCGQCAIIGSCRRGIVLHCERWEKYSPNRVEYQPKRWSLL